MHANFRHFSNFNSSKCSLIKKIEASYVFKYFVVIKVPDVSNSPGLNFQQFGAHK